MAQITTGFRSVLSAAPVYTLLMWLLGAGKLRQRVVTEFIRPQSGQRILDIGCGPGNILDHLPTDIEYVGFDSSAEYIAEAKRRYSNLNTVFFEAYVTRDTVNSFGEFDIIMSLGVLHHLSDDQALDLFETAHDSLRDEHSRLVTVDNCWLANQRKIAKYFIGRDRGQNVRTVEEYADIARKIFKSVEVVVCQDLLRVPYDHAILILQK